MPTGFQITGARSKIAEPAAKPSAGRSTAAVATAPAVCVVATIRRRRVMVSPSNAPGILRSAVSLETGCLRDSGKGPECYRSAAVGQCVGAPRGTIRHRATVAPTRLLSI